MRKHIFAFALLFCCFSAAAFAQATLFYPEVFDRGGEFGLTLSPDGRHALYVQSSGGRDTLVIMESFKKGKRWSPPMPAPFSTRVDWKDIDPMWHPAGKLLIFQSTRPVPGKPQRRGFDIWAVERTKTGWGEPYVLSDAVNSDSSESSASLAANGNLYFRRTDWPMQDEIFVGEFVNGQYRTATKLPAPLNTAKRESNPFIAPDESYLIYFSDDSSGFGDVDLFISFRKGGQWSVPQNLGAAVNSADAEFTPFVQGKRLYFSRQNKNGPRLLEAMYSLRWRARMYHRRAAFTIPNPSFQQ